MKATPEQERVILIYDRDETLLKIAKEYERGLLTDQDYLDRTIETILRWMVKEASVK